MRIRKHAKLSPLLYTTSSLKPAGTVIQTHICQLNQSPWDVMSFSPPPSPPPSQVINGNDNIIVSAGSSSVETIQVFESKGLKQITGNKQPRPLLIHQCIKSDGKSCRRCSKTAAKGNSLCEHHLSLVLKKSNNNSNKSSNPRRSRKLVSASSSNPYEFYYYSGFGRQWGKKRSGETSRHDEVSAGNNYYVEDDEHKLSPIILSQLEHDQRDYTDEDEDDDEENRQRKSRKPIKERSLKSLM